jgi:hypothetical protein
MSVIDLEEQRKKLAKSSASNAELTPNMVEELAGQQPTDNDAEAVEVLAKSHFEGFTTRSNFARKHADVVAMLGCCGLITTSVAGNQWTNLWKVTPEGLQFLRDIMEEIYEQEEPFTD